MALFDAQCSRDGAWIYGATWAPYRVHRCSASTSACESLTDGWHVRLSPAEEDLIYVLRDDPPVVWSVHLGTGEERPVHEVEVYDSANFGWGIGPQGEIVHHTQHRGDFDLWIGEARDRGDP